MGENEVIYCEDMYEKATRLELWTNHTVQKLREQLVPSAFFVIKICAILECFYQFFTIKFA